MHRFTRFTFVALSLICLSCSGVPLFDGGVPMGDGGTADGGAVDAGCLQLGLADGGCVPLAFARICDLTQVTVLQNGNLIDDAASARMGVALTNACTPPPPHRLADTRTSGVLDADGAPVAGNLDTFIAAGGSYTQRYVRWLEQAGLTPIFDSSTSANASLSLRDGGVIFTEPLTSYGPGFDTFALEFVRSRPGGPLSVVAYGYFAPGTNAAAWFFEHQVLASPGGFVDSWYVVRWLDTDADGAPSAGDQFNVLRSGR